MKETPLSRKANLVIQEMDGELLIYDLSSNKAFCLNQTSAIVWQLCDGQRTIEEISQTLETRLNSPANEDLVWFAIDQLRKEKLIENEAELNNHFAGMSRRQVIKKVGLGTMIALPIVASLVAPQTNQAVSLLPPGATFGITVGNCSPSTQSSSCTTGATVCQSGMATAQSCNGGANLVCICS